MKSKKRESWFISKMDIKVKTKVKKEAAKMGIAPWLMAEHLLSKALDGKNASK